jgi:hypothetical protein
MRTPWPGELSGANPVSFERWLALPGPALSMTIAMELPKPVWLRLVNPAANRLAEWLPANRLLDPDQNPSHSRVLQ